MGRALKALGIADIVEINRQMIAEFGGLPFQGKNNMLNSGSLHHVLGEIQGSVFGHTRYHNIPEMAAALGWRIIVGHVFNDGNKRTGMETCRVFLELNGYEMEMGHQVVDMALGAADGRVNSTEFLDWLSCRVTKIESQK